MSKPFLIGLTPTCNCLYHQIHKDNFPCHIWVVGTL